MPRPSSAQPPCSSNTLINILGASWVTDLSKLKGQPPGSDNEWSATEFPLPYSVCVATLSFLCAGKHCLFGGRNPFLKPYQVRETLNGSRLRDKALGVKRIIVIGYIESHAEGLLLITKLLSLEANHSHSLKAGFKTRLLVIMMMVIAYIKCLTYYLVLRKHCEASVLLLCVVLSVSLFYK